MCRIKVLWSLPTWNMGFLSSKVESKNGERRGIGIRNKEWRNLTRNPIKRTNGVFLSVWMHIMPPLRFSHRFWFSYLFPFLSWFLNEWTSWQLFFFNKKTKLLPAFLQNDEPRLQCHGNRGCSRCLRQFVRNEFELWYDLTFSLRTSILEKITLRLSISYQILHLKNSVIVSFKRQTSWEWKSGSR